MYGFALILFTTYVLLDVFLIPRTYQTVESTKDNEIGASEEKQSSVVTDSSYEDDNMKINIKTYEEYDTQIYVADIVVSDASYLKTALANDVYGKNITETTSNMAKEKEAILAINGDYYGVHDDGYVIRNGVLYREEESSNDQEDLVIQEDGSFQVITEGTVTANELILEGAMQVLSFGPQLVTDGSVVVTEDEEVGRAKASNPRTAIGIVDDLHYVMVVSDGRTEESEGLSLYQLATFLNDLGVDMAYNLDGGGSSTMYFNGSVVNNPTSNGGRIKERSVSDIVYIGY